MTETTHYSAKQMVMGFAELGDRGHKALMEHGEHFVGRVAVKDIDVAKTWAKWNKPKKQQCFMNAQRFAIDHPNAKYYEGYWSAHIIPVHHAWIVLDGVVIDFTAEACERYLKRAKIGTGNVPANEQDYFGVHIPTDFIMSSILKSKMWNDLMGEYLHEMSKSPCTTEDCIA